MRSEPFNAPDDAFALAVEIEIAMVKMSGHENNFLFRNEILIQLKTGT